MPRPTGRTAGSAPRSTPRGTTPRTGPASAHRTGRQATSGSGGAWVPAHRPRGWLRIFTVRSAVIILVALMGFILTLPTALQFFKQRAANDELRSQLAQIQEENAAAANELSRWEDDRFVIAQARERLTFVFPGEQAYRVVDPESVADPVPEETEGPVEDGAVTSGLVEDQPWYSTVWDSVGIAGQAG